MQVGGEVHRVYNSERKKKKKLHKEIKQNREVMNSSRTKSYNTKSCIPHRVKNVIDNCRHPTRRKKKKKSEVGSVVVKAKTTDKTARHGGTTLDSGDGRAGGDPKYNK